MSVEAPHQPTQTQEPATLTAEQQAWKDKQEAQWAEYHAKKASKNDPEEESFLNSVFNEEVVSTSEAEQAMGRTSESEEKDKGPSRLSRIKASLGAIATKITDAFTAPKSGMPQSPEEFKLSHPQATETASKKPETEKQPLFKLVDIKAKAVEIVDRTKYNMGLAKEIGVEVKDILVEKAKEKARDVKDAAIDKASDIKDVAKDTAVRAKNISIGFAQLAAYEGLGMLSTLASKANEMAKSAPSALSEHFTDAAPTPSNPNNRELNRRGKILILGLGIAASAGMLYLSRGTTGDNSHHAADLANQVPFDMPDTSSGLDTDQLPMSPDTTTISPDTVPGDQLPVSPDVSVDAVPDTPNTPDATGLDLNVDFSPDTGTLQPGDNIWDDSMQMLKEGGSNGSEQDLIDRTNALTEWRLKEMGITAEQAKYLPVGTKLPMPDSAAIQEIIARAEQLKG